MSNLRDKILSDLDGGNTVIMNTQELEEKLRLAREQGGDTMSDVVIRPDDFDSFDIFDDEDVTVAEPRPREEEKAPPPQPVESESAKRIIAEKTEARSKKQRRKRTVALIAVVAGLVLALLVGSVAVRSAARHKEYNNNFSAAQEYYYDGEYDKALESLRLAMQADKTDECLMLMSQCYEAKGDYVNAIAILESSKSGSESIEKRIQRLKKSKEAYDEGNTVIIAGEAYDIDTTMLDLSGKRMRSERLKDIGKLQELTSLKLNNNLISSLDNLKPLKKLVSLDLSDNKISDVSPLSGMSTLRTLHLDNNEIQDFKPLYKLRSLTTLTISGMKISETTLSELKEALPDCIIFCDDASEDVVEIHLGGKTFMSDVKTLDLSGCGLTNIYALSVCKKLENLNISGNSISDLSPVMDMPELKTLDAAHNKISDVRPLMSLTKLELVNLEGNYISNIAAFSELKNITELYLKDNPVKSFGALEKLTNIKYLGLQNTGIDDSALTKLYGLKHLKTAALDNNPAITKAGVDELKKKLPDCKITHSEFVQQIEIGGTKVNVDAETVKLSGLGISDISLLSQLKNVKSLDLSDNSITDFTPLYGLSTLTELYIDGNPVTPEQISEIEAALPNCVVNAM